MSRNDEVIEFAFEYARDEYTRVVGRLALLETKSQLTSAVVGIVLALIATIWPTWFAHYTIAEAILLAASLTALVCSLLASVVGSMLADVSSPEPAAHLAKRCAEFLAGSKSGAASGDNESARSLWNEAGASYRSATLELAELATERARRIKFAQMTLILGLLFLGVLTLVPLLGVLAGKIIEGGAHG